MLKPQQAEHLRNLIARHGHYQFQAGRLAADADPARRARIQSAADAATRALCAALAALTTENIEYENC